MSKETLGRRASRDDRTATGSVGVSNVAAHVLAKSSLSRIDYVDHFAVSHRVESHSRPEQWARAMFGDRPDLTEKLLWAGILRLRLDTAKSTEAIAGWTITGRGSSWIRTSASSQNASAELIIQATDETLGLATIVRYDRPYAPAIWVPVSFVHRQLVPVLLRSTVRAMSRKIR